MLNIGSRGIIITKKSKIKQNKEKRKTVVMGHIERVWATGYTTYKYGNMEMCKWLIKGAARSSNILVASWEN